MMQSDKVYPVEEALKAQKALRDLGGLGPEEFPIQAFVGMVSDEIEHLRNMGHSDDHIARVITTNSRIDITAAEIAQHYAAPTERHGRPE